jgi:hypothetical protein
MSNLTESLAQTRHGELYDRSRRVVGHRSARRQLLQGTRSRAGWALIGLGLRLALPGGRDAARGITLIGR